MHSDRQTVFSGYQVDLYDLGSHQRYGNADIQFDGSFEYRNVPYGDYQVTLTNPRGESVYQGYVTVGAQSAPFPIQVPEDRAAKPPAGAISVARLRHPPSRKAFQLFAAAQKLSQAGKYDKAAEKLADAVRISPDYAEAYTNLGVQHIRCGRYEQASAELSRAVELDGTNPLALTDLAYAQLMLRHYGEALGTAQRALSFDSGFPAAHYIAGAVLALNDRTRAAAVPHLRLAARSIPSAREQLARVETSLAAAAAGAKSARLQNPDHAFVSKP